MATPGQRARRRRQRAVKSGRVVKMRRAPIHATTSARRGRARRNQRGLLANIGNSFLPGLGGAIGQIGDNLIGGALSGLSGFAPTAVAGRVQSQQISHSHEAGTEELTTFTIPAGTPAGTVILQTLLAASTLGVRLAKFAELWTNTRFNKFYVHVVSSNPTTVSGNYTVAIDPDPVQTYTSGADLPGRLMALAQSSRANAWADATLAMLPKSDLLYNRFHFATAGDAEIREFAVGQLLIATSTDFVAECTYSVNIHWDVNFERPDTTADEDVFNPAPEPDYIILDLVGKFCNVTGLQTLHVNVNETAKCFNKLPAHGFYTLRSNFRSNVLFGSDSEPLVFDAFVINSNDSMDIFTATHLTGLTGTGSFQTQDPRPFVVGGPQRIPSRGRFITAGYAKIHPVFKPEPHVAWARRAAEIHRVTQLKSLSEKARLDRQNVEFSIMSDEELSQHSNMLTHRLLSLKLQ
jgi:hypothetical protein